MCFPREGGVSRAVGAGGSKPIAPEAMNCCPLLASAGGPFHPGAAQRPALLVSSVAAFQDKWRCLFDE